MITSILKETNVKFIECKDIYFLGKKGCKKIIWQQRSPPNKQDDHGELLTKAENS